MFARIDDQISVAPQISLADVASAAAQGVKRLVNNRPDGEAPGQPTSAEMAAAAAAAGLDYRYIPVTHAGFSLEQVSAMTDALADGQPVLAFCRSGTRSTLLWALAQAAGGANADKVAEQARGAGYDISPVRGIMDHLAAQRTA